MGYTIRITNVFFFIDNLNNTVLKITLSKSIPIDYKLQVSINNNQPIIMVVTSYDFVQYVTLENILLKKNDKVKIKIINTRNIIEGCTRQRICCLLYNQNNNLVININSNGLVTISIPTSFLNCKYLYEIYLRNINNNKKLNINNIIPNVPSTIVNIPNLDSGDWFYDVVIKPKYNCCLTAYVGLGFFTK
jgi:hypothetical protein